MQDLLPFEKTKHEVFVKKDAETNWNYGLKLLNLVHGSGYLKIMFLYPIDQLNYLLIKNAHVPA